MQAVLEKIIANPANQFSCPELPKPINLHSETDRAFSPKKQNPIRSARRCHSAPFRNRKTPE
jgi:hypothetical protein